MQLSLALVFLVIASVVLLSVVSDLRKRYRDWQVLQTHYFLRLAKRVYWQSTVVSKSVCGTWLRIGCIYIHHTTNGLWIVRHGSKRGPIVFQKEGRYVTANLAVIPILEQLCLAHLEGRSTDALEMRLQNALIKTQECKVWKPSTGVAV